MFALATFFLTALASTVAQRRRRTGPPPPPPRCSQPLETGPCLDSPRAVPKVLQAPVSRAMQVVRIDHVLFDRDDDARRGHRLSLYDARRLDVARPAHHRIISRPADATAINQVLAATHVPGQNVTGFPPQTKLRRGRPNIQQFFRVQIPPDAFAAAADPARPLRRLAAGAAASRPGRI